MAVGTDILKGRKTCLESAACILYKSLSTGVSVSFISSSSSSFDYQVRQHISVILADKYIDAVRCFMYCLINNN